LQVGVYSFSLSTLTVVTEGGPCNRYVMRLLPVRLCRVLGNMPVAASVTPLWHQGSLSAPTAIT
jgi:hypothetical protein